MQGLPAELGLQAGRGAARDHAAAVDDDEVVGELVGLLEVLRGEQHGDTVGGEAADDVPHARCGARVEAGGRLVEEQHRGPADEAGGEVEPAPHAAGVGLDRAARPASASPNCSSSSRRGPARRRPGHAEQAGDEHEVLVPVSVLVDARRTAR